MFSKTLDSFASKTPNAPFSMDSSVLISYSQALSTSRTVAAWIQKQAFFDTTQPLFTYFDVKAAYLPVILGVMQSGMPWVGLDSTFPVGHIQNLLNQVSAPKIIASKEYQKQANQFNAGQQCFNLDEILNYGDTSPKFIPDPEATALITFTSGSTQMPKGVMRSHRDVFENAIAQSTALNLTSCDCVAAGYSPNVMGFLRAFLNTIAVGGCYRPFQFNDNGKDGLIATLRDPNTNVLHIVAPVFRAIFSSLSEKDKFNNIRKLILGGDAATPHDFDLFCKYFPEHSEIFSGLGSSESGTISVWRGGQDYLPEREKLPCGTVLPSASVLFDIDGVIRKPAENEVGELLVSSSGVAQKYWNNEQLSQQKWATLANSKRYYRTGDLASFDEMGNLHHFGRVDSVAKINGFLVDPASVEFVLSQYAKVKEVAVEIDTESHKGKPVVEAFLVLKTDVDKANLDSYMIDNLMSAARPTMLYLMQELPRTNTGKIVRSSLDRSQPFSIRTGTKQDNRPDLDRLRSIWSTLLEIDKVNDDDNFLQLGGDSLNVIILTLEIEREFDVRFSVEEVSSAFNLAEMLLAINSASVKSDRKKLTTVDLISNTLSTWKGKQVEANGSGLIRCMNESGLTPLYWCLQNEHEFRSLSQALENKITFNALRSLNLLVKRTPENLDLVAEVYADAILSAHANSDLPLNLGGNCQGSELMFRIAKILHVRGVKINHFIMMEKYFDEIIDFPVTMLFGKNSERNVYRSGDLTFEYAKQRYTKLRGIYEIDGQHGRFFSKENLGSLSQRIISTLHVG